MRYRKIMTTVFFMFLLFSSISQLKAQDEMSVESRLKAARRAYEMQNLGMAESIYINILTEGDNAEAFYMLSMVCYKKGDLTQAIINGEQAIKLDPSNASYCFQVGKMYVEKGDILKGTELIQRSIELNPNNVMVNDFMLSIIANLVDQGEWQRSEELTIFCQDNFTIFEYNSLVKYFLGEIYARQMQFDKAIAYYEELLNEPLHERSKGLTYEILGSIYVEKGDWVKAKAFAGKALEIIPNSNKALNDLGVAMIKTKQYEEAVSYFKKALAINSNMPVLQKNIVYLTGLLFELRKYDLVEDLLLDVTSSAPANTEFSKGARFELARVYFLKKEMDKAVIELNGLLKDYSDPKVKAYIYRLLSTVYSGKKDIANAEKYAVLAGPGYYVLSRLGYGALGSVIMAIIILIVFLIYKAYCFFKKVELYKERMFRFRDITMVFALPSVLYPFTAIVLNLILFRSIVPDINFDLNLLFFVNSIIVELLWGALVFYFLFKKYSLKKDEVGIVKSRIPFFHYIALMIIGLGALNIAYDFLLDVVLKTKVPDPIISEVLRSTQNMWVIVMGVLMGCVIAPILEEFVFRGFFYPAFKKHAGVMGGILFSSFLFGVIHMDVFPLGFIPGMFLGMALAYLREKTGSLIPSIILHAVNNILAVSMFYFLR